MTWRLVLPILVLPGTALVFVPALVIWLTAGTPYAASIAPPADPGLWLGLALGAIGLAFAFWTVALFTRHGDGTPAPWDPPQKLVVRGPYRHVRNPMITSVLFMLAAEALLLRSWPLAGWFFFFFLTNAIYFPLVEEKGLERRHGDAYRRYKANVPRWLPRWRSWEEA